MKVRKGDLVKYRRTTVKVLDVSRNKKEAWIGIGVPVKALHKIKKVI